jgi:hypothetical protein
MFAWLISHQPAVLFSPNKPTTSPQYFYLGTNQRQPPAKRAGWIMDGMLLDLSSLL